MQNKFTSVSANGTDCCLIWCGDGQYRIRVYDKDSFKDYDILHNDLFFKICDEDAHFYTDGDKMWIDHAPSTRGAGIDHDRLLQLCAEAGFDVEALKRSYGNGLPNENLLALESLVALVVERCAGNVDHILREVSKGGGTYGDAIKEQFGVKGK